jgi:hypothetical protein
MRPKWQRANKKKCDIERNEEEKREIPSKEE